MTQQKQPVGRKVGEAALKVLLLPLIMLLALAVLTLYFLHRVALYILIWLLWLPKGKDVLVVYSDSPIWHDYMAAEVVPMVRERAIILNWSERKKWPKWSFAAHVFHAFGGDHEFNPLVVVFRPLRRAKVFRFWSAFIDWKRGYTEPVERLRQQLLEAL